MGAGAFWLLDEPNKGLDAEGRTAFETALHAHQQAGGYVLMASHIPCQTRCPTGFLILAAAI